MSIQNDPIEGSEAQAQAAAEGADDNAEFNGAWDDLDAKDEGQPADAAGRQADEADEPAQAGDEAAQGAADEASATAGTDADQPASREKSDDIWANAPAPLREAFQASEEKRKKAENLVRSNGARAAQAQNELQALKAQVAEKRDESAAVEAGSEATDKAERLKELRDEYPNLAGPILDQMLALEEKVAKLTPAEAAPAAEVAAEPTEEQKAAYAEQFTALTELHDDMPTIVQSPEYAAWLEGQPDKIKGIIEENTPFIVNAEDCSLVFDLFKAQTGRGKQAEAESLAQKRERQLRAGQGVDSSSASVTSDAGGDSFEAEWDRLDAKEKRERAAGRK